MGRPLGSKQKYPYAILGKAEWQVKLKHILEGYKTFFGCERCDYKGCVGALQFHHRDESQKKFKPTSSSRIAWATRLEEMEKCDVVCANCHCNHHWEQRLSTCA